MAHIRITADMLRDAGACTRGLEAFNSVLPDGVDCDWTEQHAAVAFYLFGEDYTWAVNEGILPELEFTPIRDSDPERFRGLRGIFADTSCYGGRNWPNRYGDWHECIREEARWFVPEYLTGSDYSGGFVCRSNFEVFAENYANGEGVWWKRVFGGYSTYAIVLDMSRTPDDALEDLCSLEGYPVLDESHMSELECEAQEEAWESWARRDFSRALAKRYVALVDSDETLDADDCDFDSVNMGQAFYAMSSSIGEYWEQQGDQPEVWIDVERIANAFTLEDFGHLLFEGEL